MITACPAPPAPLSRPASPRPSGRRSASQDLWRALQSCTGLRARIAAAHVFLVTDLANSFAASTQLRLSRWAAARPSPFGAHAALHLLDREGAEFMRLAPGPDFAPGPWQHLLVLAARFPFVPPPAPANPFAPARLNSAPCILALRAFFQSLVDCGVGCEIRFRTRALHHACRLRPAHLGCDGGRLVVDAGDTTLHFELASISTVHALRVGGLALADPHGDPTVSIHPAPDASAAHDLIWQQLLALHFPRPCTPPPYL